MPIVGVPVSGYGTVYDLASQGYVSNVLAAGGVTLTTAQSTVLPTLITASSREIIRFCGRRFDLATYSEILTPEGGRQDRGEPASVALSYFPVQSVTSVRTGRTTVLTITNTNTATNQRASVAFGVTGDVEYNDLQYVSLVLTTVASGVVTNTALSFTTYPTVNALATAINALGSGWSAVVASGGTPSPGLLPSTDLIGAREPKGAFSPGAALDAFTQDACSYDVDHPTGILRVYGWGAGGWGGGNWGAFGDPWGGLGDGLGGYGGGALGWGQVRVSYTAGFSVIPESVQQVCAEVVKGILARLKLNPALTSETTGRYTWTARDTIATLPDWARQTLTLYRDNWI